MAETEFVTKAEILSDLWMNYRQDEGLEDFVTYNDLGLPLSYAVTFDLITLKDVGKKMIEETFDVLLEALGVDDEGYKNIDDLLGGDL